MRIITQPYNVETAIEGMPTKTWDEFKHILESRYRLTYDSTDKGFYTMIQGKKRYMSSLRIEIYAMLHGHIDDMSDYIDYRE